MKFPFKSDMLNRMNTDINQEKKINKSEKEVEIRRIKTELGTPIDKKNLEPFTFFNENDKNSYKKSKNIKQKKEIIKTNNSKNEKKEAKIDFNFEDIFNTKEEKSPEEVKENITSNFRCLQSSQNRSKQSDKGLYTEEDFYNINESAANSEDPFDNKQFNKQFSDFKNSLKQQDNNFTLPDFEDQSNKIEKESEISNKTGLKSKNNKTLASQRLDTFGDEEQVLMPNFEDNVSKKNLSNLSEHMTTSMNDTHLRHFNNEVII
jgi:hypothetical protein